MELEQSSMVSKIKSLKFQPPEEGRSVKRVKRCDKHGDKDEDNSPKNVTNEKTISFKNLKTETLLIEMATKRNKLRHYSN